MSGRELAFEPGARVAVLGLGVSGVAAARLAHARGGVVYASDVASGETQEAAAAALRSEGIEAEAGRHDRRRILESDLVVTSPGVSPFSEIRQAIADAGIRTIAEVELAFRDLDARCAGITGTNGKTTVTRLAGHLLRSAGIDAADVGNVGRPLSELVLAGERPAWAILELSSFQLADMERFRPEVGVLLNLAPDHLDRYRDVRRYYADKARLFERADDASTWVLNADDPLVLETAGAPAGTVFHFSLRGQVERGAWRHRDGSLRFRRTPDEAGATWARESDVGMPGSHNVANALAAAVVAALAGARLEALAEGLRSFRASPHRLQTVGERDGVTWVDDSKATNVHAAAAALAAFDRPVVLVLGGRHKGEPYASLAPAIQEGVRGIVAFGEAAPRILADLRDSGVPIRVASGMDDVAAAAARLARTGDVVLFAPACSSFDMYPGYADRGRAFAEAFRRLPAPEDEA